MTTATPRGAQEHARRQAATVVDTMPALPPATFAHRPDRIDPEQLTWAETVGGGSYTSIHLERGDVLQLCDLDGDACAHLLLYNAGQTAERFNLADTVKVQWQAYPGIGSVLLSDLGRALATITVDTSGHHDTMCGTTTRAANELRYGDGEAQGHSPAGRELLVLAAAKHGLERRDIPASISLFQGVRVRTDGTLDFTGNAGAGGTVEIVAELAVTVLIANTAHPLDPRETFSCGRLQVLAWRGGPASGGSARGGPERSPEMARALLNTEAWLRSRGRLGSVGSVGSAGLAGSAGSAAGPR